MINPFNEYLRILEHGHHIRAVHCKWLDICAKIYRNYFVHVNINSGIISRNTLKSERPTFAEALISTAVVEAAHESLASGNNWVNVKTEV